MCAQDSAVQSGDTGGAAPSSPAASAPAGSTGSPDTLPSASGAFDTSASSDLVPPSLLQTSPASPFLAAPDLSLKPALSPKLAAPAASTRTGTAPAAPEAPSFSLPGGYGAAPLNITPGEGLYAKPPISFTTTLQLGYDDNFNSTSGKRGQPIIFLAHPVTETVGPFRIPTVVSGTTIQGVSTLPVKGSFITSASVGSEILLSASRVFLALDISAGGQYYWSRNPDPFSPSGNFTIKAAYKVTPRMLLSTSLSGGYYTQPNVALANTPTQSGQGDYITDGGTVNLSYQWTARISTVSTFNFNAENFVKNGAQAANFFDPGFGQSVQYALSPRLKTVLEVREDEIAYKDGLNDAKTQFLLTGFEANFTRRFTGSVRLGETFRQFSTGNSSTQSPYLESTINYGYGKASTLSWSTRYGFEQNGSSASSQSTFRTGFNISQAFGPQLSAFAGISYSHSETTNLDNSASQAAHPYIIFPSASSGQQDTYSLNAGLQYAFSRSLLLFGTVTRTQVFDGLQTNSYSKDQLSLGATWRY